MRSSREGQGWETKSEARSSRGGGVIAGRVFIIIIVFVFIYFISAGAVGKWIAQNMVTPVLSLFEQNDSGGLPSDGSLTSGSTAPSASPDGSKVTQKILLPDLTVYAIQIGAFSQQANAEETANQAKSRGGAGYILTDGNMRVLLSAYKTEADEKNVASSVAASEGYQTYEYVLSAKGVTFNVNAQQSNIDAIKNFFNEVQTIHDTYYDLSVNFDQKKYTAKQVTDKISQMKADTDPMIQAVDNMAQNGDTVTANMKTFADGLVQVLSADLTNKSDVEISSQLKYNYIWISDLYRKFVVGIQ